MKNAHDQFFLICKFTQCIFCFGNKRKFYQSRTIEYSQFNKMMNEIEKHFQNFASNDSVSCFHSRCVIDELVFLHVTAFKNHTAIVHKIMLRA